MKALTPFDHFRPPLGLLSSQGEELRQGGGAAVRDPRAEAEAEGGRVPRGERRDEYSAAQRQD